MALFSKLLTFLLVTYVTALPKIQHRADGNSDLDYSQYFNSEKLQEYFKENPSAFNYLNYPTQSAPENAVQMDTMSDNQQQQYGAPNFPDFLKGCMDAEGSSAASSSSSSSSSSSTSTGTKAESSSNPFDQYVNQYGGNSPFTSYVNSGKEQYDKYEKCRKKYEAQTGNYGPNGYTPPSGLSGYQPQGGFQPPSGFQPPNGFQPPSGFQPPNGYQPPSGFNGFNFPSSSSNSGSSSSSSSSS